MKTPKKDIAKLAMIKGAFRRNWGGVKPFVRVEKDKKKYSRKKKHKGKQDA